MVVSGVFFLGGVGWMDGQICFLLAFVSLGKCKL